MTKEFKEFIAKGNVLDLAVGMVIGASFKAIVDSLVADIISPIIGIFLGGVDFSGLSINIGDAQINYGNFINTTLSFLIIAFVLFMIIKSLNVLRDSIMVDKVKEEEEKEEIKASKEETLLREIRDLLKDKTKQ